MVTTLAGCNQKSAFTCTSNMLLAGSPPGSAMEEGQITFVIDEKENTVQQLARGVLSAPTPAHVSDTNIKAVEKDAKGSTTTLEIDRVSGSGSEVFSPYDRSGGIIRTFAGCGPDDVPDLKAKI